MPKSIEVLLILNMTLIERRFTLHLKGERVLINPCYWTETGTCQASTRGEFAERAVSEVADTFDLKGDGVKKAVVALAVKTAMIAHEEGSVRSHLIKEESDAYLLVILYCWQTGLFAPDQMLFPYSFEEVMTAFSQHARLDLSAVGTVFGQ